MQQEPSVTLKQMPHSPALSAAILERISNLETFCPSLVGCNVLVEPAQRHHETGNRYHVRIELTVPGEDIVVAHEASLHSDAQHSATEVNAKHTDIGGEHKDAYLAVHEAFDAARRQLQDYVRRQGPKKRVAVRQPRGRVVRLSSAEEYGFIEAEDGHEVYFQKNSVLKNGFDSLTIGSEVSFAEEAGDKGPQASTVKLAHPRRARRHAQDSGESTAE